MQPLYKKRTIDFTLTKIIGSMYRMSLKCVFIYVILGIVFHCKKKKYCLVYQNKCTWESAENFLGIGIKLEE